MTTYPNAEDYIRAVQQPRTAFRTPALQGAVFDRHPVLQIPMPASGNAAVVFRAQVGGEDCAMRFFTREDASSRDRYGALGAYFVDHGLGPAVAMATWTDDAIAVNGSRWPLVQMQWVDGRTLDAYVGHLAERGETGALAALSAEWRSLIGTLQGREFAHGDLQHGNVLIDTSSTLRLVDFDGSWIGAFEGQAPPAETGHPNYQRTGREWGRWMDTFPGLVIYTALLGLSRNPQPWAALANVENILFSQEDFAPPFRTRTWRLLEAISDPEVDRVAARLKRCCAADWTATGTLEELLVARERITTAVTAPVTLPAPPAPGTVPWWEATATGISSIPIPAPRTAEQPSGSRLLPPPPKKDEQVRTQATTPRPGPVPGSPTAPGSWFEQSGPAASPPATPRMSDGRALALALAFGLLTAVIAASFMDIVTTGAPVAVTFVISGVVAALLTFLVARSRR